MNEVFTLLVKMFFRNTTKNVVKIFRKERENVGYIPITTRLTLDFWTSKLNVGYISITAHYIDKNILDCVEKNDVILFT